MLRWILVLPIIMFAVQFIVAVSIREPRFLLLLFILYMLNSSVHSEHTTSVKEQKLHVNSLSRGASQEYLSGKKATQLKFG